MKQSVKFPQRLVGTEYLPRATQVVCQGIKFLQVVSRCRILHQAHFLFSFRYQFLQHDGLIAV